MGLVIGSGLLATVFVLAHEAFLLTMLACLGAILLRRLARKLQDVTLFSYRFCVSVTLMAVMSVILAAGYFCGSAVVNQIAATSDQLDESINRLRKSLEQQPQITELLNQIPIIGKWTLQSPLSSRSNRGFPNRSGEFIDESGASNPSTDESVEATNRDEKRMDGSAESNKNNVALEIQNWAPKLGSASNSIATFLSRALSSSLGLGASCGYVIFLAIFLAFEPGMYRNGLLKLTPPPMRSKVHSLLVRTEDRLFRWLTGRMLTMLITGAGTALGLWLLGIPMAAALGLLTAVLTFIPNLGGAIALLLAILVALPEGTSTVVSVIIMYGGLQLIESNILTPIIQKNRASIPPALLLSFQLLFGMLTGFLGLLVATPILAALMVFTETLWIEPMEGDLPATASR